VVLVAAARERKLSRLRATRGQRRLARAEDAALAGAHVRPSCCRAAASNSEEKRQQYLQIILSESDRLASLIENVLDFAKVRSAAKAGYQFTAASVRDVVARAVERARCAPQREKVELVLEQRDEPDRYSELDERAIEIAGVINLVDNCSSSTRLTVRRVSISTAAS